MNIMKTTNIKWTNSAWKPEMKRDKVSTRCYNLMLNSYQLSKEEIEKNKLIINKLKNNGNSK